MELDASSLFLPLSLSLSLYNDVSIVEKCLGTQPGLKQNTKQVGGGLLNYATWNTETLLHF